MSVRTMIALGAAFLATACEFPFDSGDPSLAVVSVTVQPDVIALKVGDSLQLTAIVVMSNNRPPRAVSWTSSNLALATVGKTGMVRGVAAGALTIIATGGNKKDSAAVVVLPNDAPPPSVSVASLDVTPGAATVFVSAAVQLIATPKDSAGNPLSGRIVTWVSSAPAIATVGSNGAVQGVAAGSTAVTATSEGKSATATITVANVPVASVAVSPATASLRVSTTIRLTATTNDSAGNVLTGRPITWATSDAGVATVDGSGLVTGVAAGSAMIAATSEAKSATAGVTVSIVPVASVTVSPASTSLLVGNTAQLAATTKDSAGNVLAGRAVSWTSNAPGFAAVSASGLVTGVAAGSATITATSEGRSATATITVANVPVALVTVSPASTSLFVGKTAQLAATTKDSAGNLLAGRTITWVSGNTTVATVSAAGLVTAKLAGSATITATSEGKIGTAGVTVANVPVASVTVSPAAASVPVGGTAQLTATTKDSAGNVLTGRIITWASGNLALATVSGSGLVTGVAAGTVTITATSEGKNGTATVTVTTASSGRAGWYAAPTGSSSGDGSSSRPWNLQTALNGGGGKVQPGDTIWLRGGTYAGTFTTSLTGTSAAPIVVRQYPGERATIDAGTTSSDALTVDGQWAIYWGFEVMMSGTQRFGTAGTGTGLRGDGVYVRNASNVKLINLIVHDVGHGTYTENTAHNIEIYGWLIYNGGYEDGSRSDGHGIYIKNDGIGWKVARDNVIFNQFGFGIHGYAESGTLLKNLVFDGNVLFNNGTPSDFDNPNMQLGGTVLADNDSVTNNMLYFSAGKGFWNARIGYNTLVNGTALFMNNYLVGGSNTLDVGYWQNLTVQSNTVTGPTMVVEQHDRNSATGQRWSGNQHYHDPSAQAWQLGGTNFTFSNWKSAAAAVDQASASMPSAPQVFVRPNWYEPGRATIVVYNWTQQGSVAVDLSGVVAVGSRYEVRNVQDIFGAPIASGTYGGGTINVPMSGVTPPQPIGGAFQPLIRTGPNFDAFIVTSAP